jgi:hypothetical protein
LFRLNISKTLIKMISNSHTQVQNIQLYPIN